jgi:hypothetical protein
MQSFQVGNLEDSANATNEREKHDAKHMKEIASTDAGIRIDVRPLSQKSSVAKRDTLAGPSKLTDSRELDA